MTEERYFVKNTSTGLNLRNESKHESALVYTVEDESVMTFLDEIGEGYGSDNEFHTWYKVSINGHIGWVRSDLVDESQYVGMDENNKEPFYGIWVSGSKNEKEMKDLAEKLQADGLDAQVYITTDWENLNKEKYYVITIGRYDIKEDAEMALEKVKNRGYNDAYIKYSGSYIAD